MIDFIQGIDVDDAIELNGGRHVVLRRLDDALVVRGEDGAERTLSFAALERNEDGTPAQLVVYPFRDREAEEALWKAILDTFRELESTGCANRSDASIARTIPRLMDAQLQAARRMRAEGGRTRKIRFIAISTNELLNRLAARERRPFLIAIPGGRDDSA
ncbi:hypothetical protein [Jiella sp. R10]|uniref:Uncharacterized protein n=2 Tax=Antarcticirhabdus aurantiaca TaxID=2606717 RepID=A0ACD4NRM1_9HYPH|nr:hypothetical protein OXU80_04135 [Jeongeuplla avenae]